MALHSGTMLRYGTKKNGAPFPHIKALLQCHFLLVCKMEVLTWGYDNMIRMGSHSPSTFMATVIKNKKVIRGVEKALVHLYFIPYEKVIWPIDTAARAGCGSRRTFFCLLSFNRITTLFTSLKTRLTIEKNIFRGQMHQYKVGEENKVTVEALSRESS